MHELDIGRHSVHAATGAPWGWEIPTYLFLGGVAAGVMIVSALLARRGEAPSRAARLLGFAAPVLVSLGMLALFLDLGQKLHVWRFYAALRVTSPMSWGAWILLLVYPVTVLFGLSQLEAGDVERGAAAFQRAGLARAFRWAAGFSGRHAEALRRWELALGVALGIYTGILLSTLSARPLWSSALLGPLFLASGLSTGTALLLLFRLPDSERHALARWDTWAIGVELLLLALFLVGLSTSGAPAREAAALLLGGRYTAPFWALVVIAGLATPLLLDVLSERMKRPLPVAAPALVLAGGFALRWLLVTAGQA